MLEILLKEDIWFPIAALTGLIAAATFLAREKRRHLRDARTIGTAAGNLFFGIVIGILGSAHIFAVSTKVVLGILPATVTLWFALPLGLALAVPAWWLTLQIGGMLRGDDGARKRALWLNVWLVFVLATQGAAVILAAPAVVAIILLWSARTSRLGPVRPSV